MLSSHAGLRSNYVQRSRAERGAVRSDARTADCANGECVLDYRESTT